MTEHQEPWTKKLDPVQLQAWFMANKPDEDLIYKSGLADQVMFVRDTVSGLVARSYIEYKRLPKVISTHTSKSVKLPVYYFNSAYARLIMRYNFHDWKVSVLSNVGPLELKLDDLCGTKGDINSCYCEGFQNEWVFPAYGKNQERFTVELRDKFSLYTFLFLFRRAALAQGSFHKTQVETKLALIELLLTKLDEFHEREKAGKVPDAQRMHGYRIAEVFESLLAETTHSPGIARYPKLEGAFQVMHEASRFKLQDTRKPAREALKLVWDAANAI